MGLMTLLLVLAIAALLTGIFVTTLKWLIIVAAVLFLASLVSGFFKGKRTSTV
jgi:hypothetical protein